MARDCGAANGSTARAIASSGEVYSVGQLRELAWTRPCDAMARLSLVFTRSAELQEAQTDVVTGMFASNGVMYFIILTTAATLHANGLTSITTAREAAETLRPLAGAGSFWLFTLGILGTGMLAVPVLAGSLRLRDRGSRRLASSTLASRPRRARKFYGVMVVAPSGFCYNARADTRRQSRINWRTGSRAWCDL